MIKPETILIVRTDRIGDVVLSLPLAGLIKRHFPDCKITFLLRNYTSDLADNHPYIDDVMILCERNGKIPMGKNVSLLKERSFDACIIVYPTYIISLIVFLSRIKMRIGSGYRWYSFLFNKRIFEHRKYAGKHELEFNVNLLKALGIEEPISTENVNFDLQVNRNSLGIVKKVLQDYDIDLNKKLIIVHPGSGGSAIDLPVERFASLVQNLTLLKDVIVIITGDENENDVCQVVTDKSGAINFAGRFNLSEIVALISICKLFISNSTGPIHIAAALDKFVIGFYTKILVCSPERWGPYTKNKVVFTPEIECTDCTREQCEKLNCMNSINIDSVIREVEKLISNKQSTEI